MDDLSKLRQGVVSQQPKLPGVDASGETYLLRIRWRKRDSKRCTALNRYYNFLPAVSDNESAAAMTVRYCDDCMRIDFDRLYWYPRREGIPVPLANIKTCPMCAFLHAFIVRRGFKISDKAKFVLGVDVFEGWKTDMVHSGGSSYTFPGRRVFIQDACDLRRPAGGIASGSYLKKRVYPRLADYSFIAKWLDECVEFHGDRCFNSRSDLDLVPGLQFIDCIARRIVPASEAADKVYLTLSYVWGAPSGSTAEDVEESGSVSTLPIRLPKVVEDSIRVVEGLGFRYLWVDRYCIPQADRRAKHIQIQLMGTIYARSAITIIAAAGEGPEYGLPGVSFRARNPQQRINFENVHVYADCRLPRSLMVYHQPGDDIEFSLWSTRGWTYQEALLSKRRLVFSDNQVFFQCQHMLCEESQMSSARASGRSEDSDNFVFPSLADFKDTSTVWERIDEFLKRNLSFDSDALNAISGILNMYRSESTQDSGVAFFCGLPLFPQPSVHQPGDTTAELSGKRKQGNKSFCETSVLIQGLLWTGRWYDKPNGAPKAEFSSKRLERPRRSGFPSWTWVGWKSTSQYGLKVGSPSSNAHFAKCAIRAVYEDRQRDLDWEKDAEQILENSALGLNPKFLDIKATCFDVSLAWRKTGVWYDEPNESGWAYTEPLACKLSGWGIPKERMPPNILEEGEGKENKLVALLLTQDWNNMEGFLSMNFLLVQPVEYSAGRWVYERVTSDLVFWDVDPRRAADLSRQFKAALEERELRLR